MELRNKFLIRSLIGFILGMFVGIAIWIAIYGPVFGAGFIPDLILSGVLGLVPFGGTVCYEIESWSLLRATLVHYSTTILIFLINSLTLGWFGYGSSLLIAVVLFTAAFFAIWLGEYLGYKKTIREMNEELEILKKKEKETR